MKRGNEPDGRVEQLLELSATGPQVLADLLDACVEHLRAMEAAKAALRHLETDEVRAAIARRHERLGEGGGS